MSEVLSQPKHELNMVDAENVQMTGIEIVLSATDNQIRAKSTVGGIIITGKSLRVGKLDVEQKVLHLTGNIESIKYATEKKPLLKRIFK